MDQNDRASKEMLWQTIDRFWETFPGTWKRVQERLRLVIAANSDITVEQFHVMRHIHTGARSVSELAEVKQISRPAISQAVDMLVEKNLVTRQQDREDRRYVQLELTQDGLNLLNAILADNRSWMMERLAALSPDEATSIQSGLLALHEALDKPATYSR